MKYKIAGIYLEINNLCNATCPYCYNNSNKIGKNLDLKQIENIIQNNDVPITISGGEPFLHPDIYRIIDLLSQNNKCNRIITNALLLTERDMDILLNNNFKIQLTLDSLTENLNDITRGIGSYSQIDKFIKYAYKINKIENIELRFNISTNNHDELFEVYNYALNNNIKKLTYAFLLSSGRNNSINYLLDLKNYQLINEILFKLESIKKSSKTIDVIYPTLCDDLGCALYSMNTTYIVPRINYRGDVYFCQLFYSSSSIIGNICNDILINIINSRQALLFIDELKNIVLTNSSCKKCIFKSKCYGGCPAHRYMLNESYELNCSICSIKKIYFKGKIKSYGSRVDN